jgi:hypothetical protein
LSRHLRGAIRGLARLYQPSSITAGPKFLA